MATRYICDGCGKDCDSKTTVDYRVSMSSGATLSYSYAAHDAVKKPQLTGIHQDLCTDCGGKIHEALSNALVLLNPVTA
jgi:hypothetical protein